MFIRKESGNFMSRRAFPYRRKKFDTDKKFKKFRSSSPAEAHDTQEHWPD